MNWRYWNWSCNTLHLSWSKTLPMVTTIITTVSKDSSKLEKCTFNCRLITYWNTLITQLSASVTCECAHKIIQINYISFQRYFCWNIRLNMKTTHFHIKTGIVWMHYTRWHISRQLMLKQSSYFVMENWMSHDNVPFPPPK